MVNNVYQSRFDITAAIKQKQAAQSSNVNSASMQALKARAEIAKSRVASPAYCAPETKITQELGQMFTGANSQGGAKFTDQEVKMAMSILEERGLPLTMLAEVINYQPQDNRILPFPEPPFCPPSGKVNISVEAQRSAELSKEYSSLHSALEQELKSLMDAGMDVDVIREEVAVVRTNLNTTKTVIDFIDGDTKFYQDLSKLVKSNPSIANDPQFKQLLAEHVNHADEYTRFASRGFDDYQVRQGSALRVNGFNVRKY